MPYPEDNIDKVFKGKELLKNRAVSDDLMKIKVKNQQQNNSPLAPKQSFGDFMANPDLNQAHPYLNKSPPEKGLGAEI